MVCGFSNKLRESPTGLQWMQAERKPKWLREMVKPQKEGKKKGCWDGGMHMHGTIVQPADTWVTEKRKTSDKGDTHREQVGGRYNLAFWQGWSKLVHKGRFGRDVICTPQGGGARRRT